MNFDNLVNSILNEDESLDQWHKAQMDKETSTKQPYKIDIIGDYRGSKDVLATLVGTDTSAETINGVAGDGSDEYKFNRGFEAVVDYGQHIGLWEEEPEGLVVIDPTQWDHFYDEMASDKGSEPSDEYEHKGWPGDGSGEDDFADYNQNEGNDY